MCLPYWISFLKSLRGSSLFPRKPRKPPQVSKLLLLTVSALLLSFATSCTHSEEQRVVLIPPIVTDPVTLVPTDIIRAGPGIEGKVWFPAKSGEWELSSNVIKIPEGWYIIPPPKRENND